MDMLKVSFPLKLTLGSVQSSSLIRSSRSSASPSRRLGVKYLICALGMGGSKSTWKIVGGVPRMCSLLCRSLRAQSCKSFSLRPYSTTFGSFEDGALYGCTEHSQSF